MGLPDIIDLVNGLAQVSPPDISPLPQTTADSIRIRTVLTIVFTTLGAISVLMIVIGGIKYSGSQGDPQGISKAKGTIIYAIVGLIVAIMAVSIVDFVLGRVA
jgi:hypothetical protein